jgi:hypothetical protein
MDVYERTECHFPRKGKDSPGQKSVRDIRGKIAVEIWSNHGSGPLWSSVRPTDRGLTE